MSFSPTFAVFCGSNELFISFHFIVFLQMHNKPFAYFVLFSYIKKKTITSRRSYKQTNEVSIETADFYWFIKSLSTQ